MTKIRILLGIFVVFGLACDFRVERDPRELVYHLGNDPSTLNPVVHTDAYAGTVESFIFDSLIERDNVTLEFKPLLAKKWEVSPDHLQYTFYLRDDVTWHDGEKFTADDVIYSFERIQDPKVDAAPLRVYYRDVKRAEKIDDTTVRFTYAFPYYRAFLMLGGLPIVPKHIFEKGDDFNTHPASRVPVGNGPFKFGEWKTGRSITLLKNEDYWGKVPDIQAITFKIITDSDVVLQVLKKGEIDFASLTSLQWVKQTDSENFSERFGKHKYFSLGYSFIAWNQERSFFKDKRVRRAMTMMVDRERLREKLYYGLPEIVTGEASKFGRDYNPAIRPLPYDPDAAAALLDEAGWTDHDGDGIRDKDGVPFRFTFMLAGTGSAERIANILRENLKKAGIEMEISRFEWTVFQKNLIDMAFDATMLAWTGLLETDPYQTWHSSQIGKGSNFIGFKNAEADRLIEEARREFDPGRRQKMYWRFHEILHEEQPYTFLFMAPALVAVHKRFTNVNVYKLGVDIREWGVGETGEKLYQ